MDLSGVIATFPICIVVFKSLDSCLVAYWAKVVCTRSKRTAIQLTITSTNTISNSRSKDCNNIFLAFLIAFRF